MIFVNTLGIFLAPFDNLIIDFAEDEGEDKAADDVTEGVHVGEDTAGAGEGDADYHEDFEGDAGGFVFDVAGENDGGDKEDGGDDHDVGGGEGGFAGAVGAGGEDDEFVKNEVGDGHEDDRHGHPGNFGVDFGEIFALDPLVEAFDEESGEG